MAPVLRRLMSRTTLALALAIGLVGAGVGATSAAKPVVVNCEGTYLAQDSLFDPSGTPVGVTGAIFTFAAGGSLSVARHDTTALSLGEAQTDGQGSWTCSGATLKARAFDFYSTDPGNLFELDRYDYSATLSSGVLTGTVQICSWTMQVNTGVVRTETYAQCQTDPAVTFFAERTFSATLITP